jgi:hypothetical protein
MGMGCGRRLGARSAGRGLGFRNRYYATGARNCGAVPAPSMTPEQEQSYLDNEIKALENELDAARKRSEELSNK